MSSIDEFFRFIRAQFAPIAGIKPAIGDGTLLCEKVKSMVADRNAAIAAHKLQSGVAIATTDLDQAVDLWIELMDRRKIEREKSTVSTQAEEEKEKASIMRENLVRTLSEKHTFQEVSSIDIKETDSKRDKRRKTGEAWAKGKAKEEDKGELISLIKEMVNSVNNVTASMSTTAKASSSTAPTDARLDILEMDLQEMRELQQTSSTDILDIRVVQQNILSILSDLRKQLNS